MRGRIIFVNPETMTGLIFGADRQRYNFELSEWDHPTAPPRNLEVNFQAQGNEAVRIKPFAADYADEPLYTKAKKVVAATDSPTSRKAPKLSPLQVTPPPVATGLPFDDGATLPTGVSPDMIASRVVTGKKTAPLTLTPEEQALLEDDEAATRPSWKFYLIGVAAALVLLLILFLIQLFTKHS